jgi:hypothetical protein
MKKYEMTENKNGNLTQIRALIDIPLVGVKAGDLGGWIEKEENLSHEGDCWVSGNGCVSGNGRVYENGCVSGNADIKRNCAKPAWTLDLGKHTITVDDGFLNIGCMSFSIEHWMDNFEEIGKKEGYSEEEIERYGKAINFISEISDKVV